MSHNIFNVLFDSNHYTHPFSCSCHDYPLREDDHSLSLAQKIFAVAAAILVGIPTFGVGGVLTFYMLTASFKARNSVWIRYLDVNPGRRHSWSFFQPDYWGVPVRLPSFSGWSSYRGSGRPAWEGARGGLGGPSRSFGGRDLGSSSRFGGGFGSGGRSEDFGGRQPVGGDRHSR